MSSTMMTKIRQTKDEMKSTDHHNCHPEAMEHGMKHKEHQKHGERKIPSSEAGKMKGM